MLVGNRDIGIEGIPHTTEQLLDKLKPEKRHGGPSSNTADVESPASPSIHSATDESPNQPGINFDYKVQTSYKIVNQQAFGGIKNFKDTFGVDYKKCSAIKDIIEYGINYFAGPKSNFETKYNAVVALCANGIAIMDAAPSSFATTMKHQAPRKITDTIAGIVRTLTEEEKSQAWSRPSWLAELETMRRQVKYAFMYEIDPYVNPVDDIIEMCRSTAAREQMQ